MQNTFSELQNQIEQALNKALNMDFTKDWQNQSFGELPESICANPVFIQNLIEPNKALMDLGGKRWRPILLMLCYQMAKENPKNAGRALDRETALSLTPLVEFVHTASLIHDDIEDSADLRRGKPAAYITYGTDTALNCASWLYFEAPVCLQNSLLTPEQKLTFYTLYTNELRRLHLGQAMDIYWHKNKDIFPKQEEYYAMVRSKTGTLASLAAQVGMTAGGATKEDSQQAGNVAAEIGIGFQIIDDVINLTKGNPGKKRGDDIVEGKKSLPVLIHIQENPQDKEKICALMEQAGKEGIDSAAVEECISILQSSGCIQKAAAIGKDFITSSCAKFKDSPLITQLFTSMIPEDFR